MSSKRFAFTVAASAISLAAAFMPASEAEAGGRYDGHRPIAPNSARDFHGSYGHGHGYGHYRAPRVPNYNYGHRGYYGGYGGYNDWQDYRRDEKIRMDNAWRRAQRDAYRYGYPAVPVYPAPAIPRGYYYDPAPRVDLCIRNPGLSFCIGN